MRFPDYVPTAGDCFEIVTAGDRAGLFEIEDFEDLGAQLFFHDFVLESSLDLENWAEADTVVARVNPSKEMREITLKTTARLEDVDRMFYRLRVFEVQ